MELIDTHAHLTFDAFEGQVDDVIRRGRDAGVTSCITVGTTLDDSRKAVALAGRYDGLYATVAVHPHDAKNVTADTMSQLGKLAKSDKVVAVGETGLDFHYNFSTPEQQKQAFIRHIELAGELALPLIIHSREAFDETLAILDARANEVKKIVFHCFSGSAEQAKILLDKGYYISFTGVVTFKNAEKTRDTAKIVPLDRLMLETDCPYMSPEPMRKQKVNEPALLIHTARFLAELKDLNFTDFAAAVTTTTKSFFTLP